MNEDRLSSLINEFAEPIVATHVRPRPVRSRKALRLGVVGVGLVAALVTGLAILPGNSDAATLHRIETAISNAKSMIVVESAAAKGSKTSVYNTTWYDRGLWRADIYPGLGLAKSFIVRDGKQYIYSPKHKTLTVEPGGEWTSPMGRVSALDFAKMRTDIGEIGVERTIAIEPHAPVNGRETYQVVMTRQTGGYRSEILVDKATDLPIQARTMLAPFDSLPANDQVENFRFNEPISIEMFDPKSFGLPIQDLPGQQGDLLRKWAVPLATCGPCEVRDVWQNREGEVYVVYTRPTRTSARALGLTGAPGTTYIHVDDIGPGEIRGDTSVRDTFRFEGADTRISVWAPLERPDVFPTKVSVSFERIRPIPGLDLSPVSLSVPPPSGDDPFPPYSTTLVLRDYEEQLAIHLATVRAKWYEDHKDLTNALAWRRTAYARAREWVPGIADREYKPVVDKLVHDMGLEKP